MRPRQLAPPNVGTGSELGKGETQWPSAVPLASICFTIAGARCVLMEMSIGVHTIFLHGVYNMICTASGSNQKVNSPRIIYKLKGCPSADSDGDLEILCCAL